MPLDNHTCNPRKQEQPPAQCSSQRGTKIMHFSLAPPYRLHSASLACYMTLHNQSIIIILVISLSLLVLWPSASQCRRWCLQSPLCRGPSLVTTSPQRQVYLTCFKVSPPAHCDLATVKFTLVLQSCLLRRFPSRLSSIAPTEVVKLPEGVRRQDKVPNGQRQQVDKHPGNIRPPMCCDNNENRR